MTTLLTRGRILVLAVSFALGGLAGTANGDTFRPGAHAIALPSSTAPNLPGALRLPAEWTSHATIARPRSFEELRSLWQQAGAAYGIQWPVLAAINKIESNFGQNMGPSSAGAVGWMQFMPSTWVRWGIDADGDGVADPWNADDAIFAAARYLAASGGSTDIRSAVFSYNHADWYVNEVLSLAATFARGASFPVAGTSGPSQKVLDAERAVADTNRQLKAARKLERRLALVHARNVARMNAATILSDRLALQRPAVLAGIDHNRAASAVARLESEVVDRQQTLESARAESIAPPGTTPVLGAPAAIGDWVFPVGGGPSQVSVAHTHHDYPAADIAAPEGSPIYAISDAAVLRSWTDPDPRCGIGLTIRTSDGREWTYCHLSYLDPAVLPGVTLSAGTPVGLVGSTGDATGPHLHLQLDPPTSYPQEETWFQAFAGKAFRWQDAPTPEVGPPAPPARVGLFAAARSGRSDAVIGFTR
jgi:murein DD-endopeptidase MepM/ murein hydrolase activator NlpD